MKLDVQEVEEDDEYEDDKEEDEGEVEKETGEDYLCKITVYSRKQFGLRKV